MPFEQIGAPRVRGQEKGTANNVVASATIASEKDNRYSLSLRFGAQVLARLGWQVNRDRLLLLEGTGREVGLLKIVVAPAETPRGHGLSAYGSSTDGTGTVKLNFSVLRWHDGPGCRQFQTECEFQAFGGEMLLMLPEWVARRTTPKPTGRDK